MGSPLLPALHLTLSSDAKKTNTAERTTVYKHMAGHWVGLGVVTVGPALSLYTHTQKCLAIDTYQHILMFVTQWISMPSFRGHEEP